jgi:hypothetical protein
MAIINDPRGLRSLRDAAETVSPQIRPPVKPAPQVGGRPEPASYWHETDRGNIESIRNKGLIGRERFEGGRQVSAFSERPKTTPPGRALVEFKGDPAKLGGRGTTPGSSMVTFRGNVPPEDILHAYAPGEGKLFGGVPGGMNALANAAMIGQTPMPSGQPAGNWLLGKMGISDWDPFSSDVNLQNIAQHGARPVPQPYGADIGWGGNIAPPGSLMEYATAQSALPQYTPGVSNTSRQPRRGRTR